MLTEKRLQVGRCRFNYLEGGPAEAKGLPVLFLHGWPLAAYTFRDGLERLARQRRVIAPDLPGFNQSLCSTTGWAYEDYAEAVAALASALGVPRFHLAGHSTGGGVAIVLAANFPARVSSLMLIDSAGVPLKSFGRVLGRKLLEQPAQAWTTGFARQHLPMLTAVLYNGLFRLRNTYSALHLPLHVDLRPQLATVRAPGLVVWGEKDRTEPLALGQALAAEFKGASFTVLANAYHEWSVLRPQLFAEAVERFVRALE